MAEGGWSWRRTLMFFSWHELKWWEFKDSICFLFDELRWWGWRRFYYFFSIREDAQLCKICHEPQTTCCITSFLSRLCFFCLFVFFTHKQKFKKKNKVQKVRHVKGCKCQRCFLRNGALWYSFSASRDARVRKEAKRKCSVYANK